MTHRPKVALLIESSRAYGRGLLRGIAAYARTHGRWSIFHQERAQADDVPDWLHKWKGDGVIARIETPRLISQLQKLNLPTIDLRGLHDVPGIPLIETNDQSVVRLAIDHLLERGFTQFAYCGFAGTNYSDRRLRYLRELLAARGVEAAIFNGSGGAPRKDAGDTTTSIEVRGLMQEAQIADWIAALPKPIGLIACNDVRGQQVLNACNERGIAVPDEVAVIGVDDDEVLCELCNPPLTSVAPNTEKIGYEAAALLDAMMAGRPAPEHKMFIEPRGVVTRQSTDVLAVADRDIAAAVRFIREHAMDGISVESVLAQVPLSRSTLERRFSRLLGRSPKAEILRVQLERVKQLLRETDFTLPKIAQFAGFKHPEYMCAMFKHKTGMTPGDYRRSTEHSADLATQRTITQQRAAT
ncbi:MAG: helix-turn-helix domain-containing protein [Planctomycetes bacterium]|nr:helix-turn-helix domain-containing protein [Planctomycetota bacterium]